MLLFLLGLNLPTLLPGNYLDFSVGAATVFGLWTVILAVFTLLLV
jgi:hypothetical protein